MADTVALSGYMWGPIKITPDPPNPDIWEFTLTHPSNPGREITVEWRQIWWIDAYPEPYADQPGGRDPHHLGRRTIWVDSKSDLIAKYVTGDIVESTYLPPGDNLEGWTGPQMAYGAGPRGTTYPPCLCPR
jgi:hypothetical protein